VFLLQEQVRNGFRLERKELNQKEMKENPRLHTLAVRSTAPRDSPRPADAGSDLVGIREGDPAIPPVTGDNLQVVQRVAEQSCDGATPPASRPPTTSCARSGGERGREKREWLRVCGRVHHDGYLFTLKSCTAVDLGWTAHNTLGWFRPRWAKEFLAQAFAAL
jgi:hypothetical protein